MDAEITIKNYRCFPDSAPARFSLKDGFTAFVGPNNSGKSSLLRFFYEFRDLFRQLLIPAYLQQALQRPTAFNLASTVADPSEVFHKGNERDIHIAIELPRSPGSVPLLERIEIVVSRDSNQFTASLYFQGRSVDRAKGPIGISGDTVIQASVHLGTMTNVFHLFRVLSNTLYIGSFRNPLNIGSRDAYYDIQIGQAFITAWKAYKTGTRAAWNETAYRVERDIGRIFGYDTFQVNSGPEDQSVQVFINGKSFKLGELGSGMAQFILVLANAAMREPSVVLIDEPELNLHPALQIDFLTTLASYAPVGVMYATHSLGLARATAPQIYSLRKQSEFETRIVPLESTPRLSEFLGEMSFGGYQELGFGQVLLVEGRTDVLAIQQLLRLLGKDHEVVLLPLGGSALINGTQETELQLLELTRISPTIAAVIDCESTAPGEALSSDRAAFRELCETLGINCHILERRAIENYWTESAVQKIKGPNAKSLTPFEKVSAWGKNENWRIARAMTPDELKGTDLGHFLDSLGRPPGRSN